MNALAWMVPLALGMGFIGLMAFLWSMNSGQLEDLDGAAVRVLLDKEDRPIKSAIGAAEKLEVKEESDGKHH